LYFYLDDPVTSTVTVLYNLIPALAPLLPGLLIALWAARKLSIARVDPVAAPIDGAEMAARILIQHGVTGWTIVEASEPLATFCDPWRREIRLSKDVASARTSTALGTAAREAGHALQAAQRPWFAWVRTSTVLALKLGMGATWLVLLAGLLWLSPEICRRGSILYTSLVLVLLGLQWLEADSNRRARGVTDPEIDLGSGTPAGRILEAAKWSEIAAACPVGVGWVSRIRMKRASSGNREARVPDGPTV